ncbi:Fe-S cluster assembly protein SufD [Aestuariibacter salexigens]|uniref:Fe-S cluster assembly protein SufD n=1 Tax=Aestuariibacter salexigens TaxID=226010 RepID=UPI00041D5B32|nr:Fe-S cluster assembly protein SufD [Aestuariibacter salexigens]
MSQWFESAIVRAEQVNDWLSPVRAEALQTLKRASWPTRKTEAWKYLSLRRLEKSEFAQQQESAQITPEIIEGLDSLDLTFVDGQLVDLPADLPAGLSIVSLQNATDSVKQWAGEIIGDIKPERHLFGLINDTLAQHGVIIDVAEGVSVERPIRISYMSSEGSEAHTRVLVRVASNASVTVIEQAQNKHNSLHTSVAEYAIHEQAELTHYGLMMGGGAAMHVAGMHFRLAQQATLNSHLVGFGSELNRLDVDVQHRGEQADANINAVYLLRDAEVFDLHSTIEHEVPHCTTDENVRGIVADRSKAVFNGRIHIHRDAQKTLAELNNKNLLLSREAQINTKPELEIYADDVKCAHGATVAEIDKKALYYLQSRGISREQALVMLNFGFINALVDEMPHSALAEWLRPILRNRFASMDVQ